jgi:glycosyltransferase involved in cell wall biosynthesis
MKKSAEEKRKKALEEQRGVPEAPSRSEEPAKPQKIIGRFVEQPSTRGAGLPAEVAVSALPDNGKQPAPAAARPIPTAVFCHEPPDSYIGGHVARTLAVLAGREPARGVHLFSRHPFVIDHPGVRVHVVGTSEEGDLVDQALEFTRRAGNAFLQQFPASMPVGVIGYEWTSAPVLSLLRGLRNQSGVLSLHSLERQRSDLSSDIARKIADIEREGIETARTLIVHDGGTAEVARHWLPECADRTVLARSPFSTTSFETGIDPGAVKARYQVGPVDPLILYVGDLDERYGPDLLLKAMPAVLRHHPQARLVIVGEGQLLWPLRVYARYLLLEHAVRLVGSVTDQPMAELMQAANIVAVPSRESTPWWPILGGWAARRPVVATHDSAKSLLDHEKDSVLVYPSENSIVWGLERVLYDPDLAKAIGQAGRQKLEARFGWSTLAEQVEEILASSVPVLG